MSAPAPLLLATRSAGKLWELRPLFEQAGISVIDLTEAGIPESAAEDAIEAYPTFEENSLAKARYFWAKSGRPTIADDSGLELRALGGRPGVLTKRWSGRTDLEGRALDVANNATLLRELGEGRDHAARYVCAAAYVDGRGEIVRRGESGGVIVRTPRGSGGFGYDPYFESTELGRTFAEASLVEKERVSHRGRAFRALLDAMGRAR